MRAIDSVLRNVGYLIDFCGLIRNARCLSENLHWQIEFDGITLLTCVFREQFCYSIDIGSRRF